MLTIYSIQSSHSPHTTKHFHTKSFRPDAIYRAQHITPYFMCMLCLWLTYFTTTANLKLKDDAFHTLLYNWHLPSACVRHLNSLFGSVELFASDEGAWVQTPLEAGCSFEDVTNEFSLHGFLDLGWMFHI